MNFRIFKRFGHLTRIGAAITFLPEQFTQMMPLKNDNQANCNNQQKRAEKNEVPNDSRNWKGETAGARNLDDSFGVRCRLLF